MISRSANNFGSATVTALNVVELATIVTTSASTTRHIASFATRADRAGLFLARPHLVPHLGHERDAKADGDQPGTGRRPSASRDTGR